MAVFDIPEEGLPQISIEQILELLRTPPSPEVNPLRDRPPQVPPVQGAGPQNAPPPAPEANPMRTEQPQVPPVQGAGPAPNLPVLELLSALGSQTPPVPGQNPVRAEEPQVPPVQGSGPQQPAPQLPDLSLMDTGAPPQGLGSSGPVQNMGESATAQTGQGLIDFIRNNVPQVDPISILTSDFAQQFNPLTPLPEDSIFQPGQDSISQLPGDTIAEMLSNVGGSAPGTPAPPTDQLPELSILPGAQGAPESSRSGVGDAGAPSSADGETGSRAADTGSVSPDIRARADRIKAALGGRSQAQNDALRQFAISLLQPIFEGQEFALIGNALQNAQGTFEGTRAQQQAARQQAIENQQEAAESQLSAAETAADIELKRARAQHFRSGGARSGKTNDIESMLDQFNIQSPAARAFFREKFSSAFEADPTTLEQPSGQEALTNLVAEARQIDAQANAQANAPAGPAAQENAQLQELRSLAAQGMARNDLIDEGSVAQAASNPQAEQVLLKAFENNPEELARLKERINAYRTGGAASTAAGATQ